MKQRVAILAACLTLVCSIAITAVCVGLSKNSINANAMDDLRRICRLSARDVGSAAFDDGLTAALKAIRQDLGVEVTLLDPQGEAVYDSRLGPAANEPLEQDPEVQAARREGEAALKRGRPSGGEWIFCAMRLENGGLLRMATRASSGMDVLGGLLGLIIVLMAAVALITYLGIMGLLNRSDVLLNRAARVLEEFAEGHFDARIKGVKENPDGLVTQFNEAADRIQERLFKQKSRNEALGTVMTRMQTGMLAVDQQLNVLLVTPAAKKLLGITGSPEGHPVSEASKDVHLDTVLSEAMQLENVYTKEVAARTAVGRGHRPIRLYVSPMREEGKAVGAVALVEDITELRRLEQVRTDFVANVSHELKTPLTSIKGFVETLQAGAISKPEMAQKFLNIIMLEADRLTRLINDILSISKLESGTDQVPNEKIALDKMAYEIADMLSIHAAEKQVTIQAPKADDGHVFIWGNPDRVEQMLINLVDNAIKYNKQGGSVTVSVFGNDKEAYLSVSDTGIGIAEEHLPRMFERFYRVDKGRSRSMGGTGLGLAIVKHIVMSMNGNIEVHSKLGEGTEFLITIPTEKPENAVEPKTGKDMNDVFFT